MTDPSSSSESSTGIDTSEINIEFFSGKVPSITNPTLLKGNSQLEESVSENEEEQDSTFLSFEEKNGSKDSCDIYEDFRPKQPEGTGDQGDGDEENIVEETGSSNLENKVSYKCWSIENFYIGLDTLELVQFREELDIVLLSNPLAVNGTFNISVKEVEGKGDGSLRSLLVHVSGKAVMDDAFECSTSITSHVTSELTTIEEKRLERTDLDIGNKQQEMYLGSEEKQYHCVTQVHIDNNLINKSIIDIPSSEAKDLISEGANVILLRQMALKNFQGELEINTILADGRICPSKYTCEGKSIINRDGEDLTVYFIKREVQETPDLVQTLMSTLTCAGQLLEHEWVGGLYLVRVSPYKKVTNVTKGFVDKPIPLEYNWESDMELSSYFLDQKDRQHALHRSYFADKPETKALIADFLQAVLLLKPEDVIQFAIDYFSIFTPDTDEDERLKAEDYEMASGVMNDVMSLVMKHITEKEMSELVEELVTSALKRVESKDLLESLEIMIKSAGAISEILNIILNFFMEEADDGVVSGFLAIILRSAIKYEGEEVVVEILNKIVSTVEEQALVLEVVKLSQQENSEDVVLELLEKLLKSTEETVKNEEEELVSDILEEIIQLSVETAERKESKEIADTLISELVEGVMQPEGQAAEEQDEGS